MATAKLIRGFIDPKTFTIKHDLGGKISAQSSIVAITSNTNYGCAPFSEATIYLSIENTANLQLADLPQINITLSFSTYLNDNGDTGTQIFKMIFSPSSVMLDGILPVGKNKIYYYQIKAGHAQLPRPQLASRLTKVYQGSPKDVIEQTLLSAGLKKEEFNLENLKSPMFTANKAYYAQTAAQTTYEFITALVAELAGSFYVRDTDQCLCFNDTPMYQDQGTNLLATIAAQSDSQSMSTQNQHHSLMVYNFRKILQQASVGKANFASYSTNANNANDLKSGSTQELPNVGQHSIVTSNSLLNANDLNNYATAILESENFMACHFTGVSTFPLSLGLQYSITSPFDNNVLKLTPIKIKSVLTFFDEQQINFKQLCKFTGLMPNQFYYETTFIEAKYLPRLPFQGPINTPLFFEAVVLSQAGELTGKPMTGDKIQVGLLHGHIREANKPFNVINVQRRIEEASIDNASPAPGSIVKVIYDPITREFILLGIVRNGKFTLNTTYQNDSNAQYPVTATRVMAADTITDTVETNNVTMNKDQQVTTVNGNELTLNKDGAKTTIPEKLTITAKEVTVTADSDATLSAKSVSITGNNSVDVSGGNISVKGQQSVSIKAPTINSQPG